MNRKISYCFSAFLLLLTVACFNNEHKGANNEKTVFAVDTQDAKATYQKVKGLNEVLVDSIYKGLFIALDHSNQYELLHQHVRFYKQLAGQREEARAWIARSEGLSYNFFTKYDSSIAFFNEAIALYTRLHETGAVADCYYGQAINYYLQSNYTEALKCDYKALGLYEQLRDSADMYMVKIEVGVVDMRQHEYDSALPIEQACQSYFKRTGDGIRESYTLSLIGQIYYYKNDLEKAVIFDDSSLAARRLAGDKAGVSAGLNNISTINIQLKKWDKAASGFYESLEILREMHDERQIPIVKENLANCLWHMGKVKEAEEMLFEVIDSAQQKKQERIIGNAYMLLYNFSKEDKDYKRALEYHELYKVHNDSLFNIEKARAIGELNVQYETSKKEEQIAQLSADKKVDNIKKLVYLLVLLSTAIIAILTILFLSGRIKKNRLMLEKVKLELEANARELKQFTESIIAKNKVIEDLEQKQQISEQGETNKEDSEQLSQLYQLKILTEDDWRQFKILFDKVYPGTISKLRERYPDLAPAEERQFLLIKLKINNKECADMLGISPLSIKKNRYRLKKRFNLGEQDDLDEFVWNFG